MDSNSAFPITIDTDNETVSNILA